MACAIDGPVEYNNPVRQSAVIEYTRPLSVLVPIQSKNRIGEGRSSA